MTPQIGARASGCDIGDAGPDERRVQTGTQLTELSGNGSGVGPRRDRRLPTQGRDDLVDEVDLTFGRCRWVANPVEGATYRPDFIVEL